MTPGSPRHVPLLADLNSEMLLVPKDMWSKKEMGTEDVEDWRREKRNQPSSFESVVSRTLRSTMKQVFFFKKKKIKIMLFATSLNWTEELDGTRLLRNAFLLILSKRMGS